MKRETQKAFGSTPAGVDDVAEPLPVLLEVATGGGRMPDEAVLALADLDDVFQLIERTALSTAWSAIDCVMAESAVRPATTSIIKVLSISISTTSS
jgi:hypothetical protein